MWRALAGIYQLAGHRPTNWKVAGSIPGQGTYLGCSLVPSQGASERQLINISLTHWCFSPSLPPFFSLSLKINKYLKRNRNLRTLLVRVQDGTVTLENSLAVPQNVKLSYHLTLLSVRAKKTYIHTKPCTRLPTAALFLIAPKWKQPKCPPTDGETKCAVPVWGTRPENRKRRWRKSQSEERRPVSQDQAQREFFSTFVAI